MACNNNTDNETIKTLEEALQRIVEAGRLDVAKEIAAEVLGVDVEDFTEEHDLDTLEFTRDGDNGEYLDDLTFNQRGEEYPYNG